MRKSVHAKPNLTSDSTANQKSKPWLVSLRFSILSIFISLFLLMTLLIIIIRSIAFSNEVTFTSLTMMRYASDSIYKELLASIHPLEVESKFSAHLLQSGVLNDKETQLIPYTYYLVKTMPLVRGAYYGDETGSFVYARKAQDGSVISEIFERNAKGTKHKVVYRDQQGNITKVGISKDLVYDPRIRPWYIDAKAKKHTIWTDIYRFYPNLQLGITTATPVVDASGKIQGVFGFDVSLDYLSRFVSGQKISPHGFTFIITQNENLVAYPNHAPFNLAREKTDELVNVHQVRLPFIDQSLDIFKKTGQQEIVLDYNKNTYLITYRLVPELSPQGWLIGVVTPRSDLIGFLYRVNIITILITFIVLAIGILIVSNLVTRVVQPIHKLVLETEKIRRFELDGDVKILSRIKEVVVLKNAVRAMKRGLRQFQTYVPKLLVKQLVESGQDIRVGGERKELVVLFSDIKNFTSIAEHMDPDELMMHICEYFEAISQIIISENGTIDKYIGDSVMAFWGAPLPELDPWDHAARAALRIQAKVAELNRAWHKQRKPRMTTRIGIHSGDAIVGNIGSSERFNYTALGDTINITSRLESLNKVYKTKIAVSEAMYDKLKDKFILRLVDCVMIKGRTETIRVYELLGDDITQLAFDFNAYEAEFMLGFDAYQAKRFAEAITHFKRCLKIYPEDELVPILIGKCS